jgi:hypothetical protein
MKEQAPYQQTENLLRPNMVHRRTKSLHAKTGALVVGLTLAIRELRHNKYNAPAIGCHLKIRGMDWSVTILKQVDRRMVHTLASVPLQARSTTTTSRSWKPAPGKIFQPAHHAVVRSTACDFKSMNLQLLQISNMKEKQRLVRIFDSRILTVSEKTPAHSRSYTIHLALLDPAPRRIYNINLNLLTAFMVLEVLTYALYALKDLHLAFVSGPYIYTAIILLAASSIIMLLLTIKSLNNKWIFHTARGKIEILELFNNNPDRARFQQCLDGLIKRIKKAKLEHQFSSAELAAAEVSEHRRLRDEGIISHEQYEQAKTNILF